MTGVASEGCVRVCVCVCVFLWGGGGGGSIIPYSLCFRWWLFAP